MVAALVHALARGIQVECSFQFVHLSVLSSVHNGLLVQFVHVLVFSFPLGLRWLGVNESDGSGLAVAERCVVLQRLEVHLAKLDLINKLTEVIFVNLGLRSRIFELLLLDEFDHVYRFANLLC